MDDLLEWAALVCSLSGSPLSNFTISFIKNEPFHCIYRFYFPGKGITLPQTYLGHLSNVFGRSLPMFLIVVGEHKGFVPQFHDMRTIITTLALLASRILIHNDRIEVLYST